MQIIRSLGDQIDNFIPFTQISKIKKLVKDD